MKTQIKVKMNKGNRKVDGEFDMDGNFYAIYKKHEIFIDKEDKVFYYRLHDKKGLLVVDGWEQDILTCLKQCLENV